MVRPSRRAKPIGSAESRTCATRRASTRPARSASYHDRKPKRDSREAASLFALLSLARWTDERVPVVIEAEYERTWQWNEQLTRGFLNDPQGYGAAVRTAAAEAWLGQVTYWVTPRFAWVYKFDRLVANRKYPSDGFDRHGFGFRAYVAPNALVQLRTEFAKARHPSEKGSTATGGQDATFATFQYEL